MNVLERMFGFQSDKGKQSSEYRNFEEMTEAAKAVRVKLVDLLQIGAISSQSEIPSTNTKDSTRLHYLLGYSEKTKKLASALRNILAVPSSFIIGDDGANVNGLIDEEVDSEYEETNVLYKREFYGHVFNFPDHLIYKYYDSVKAVYEELDNSQLSIAIELRTRYKFQYWMLNVHIRGTNSFNYYFPEEACRLHFVLSPRQLQGMEALNLFLVHDFIKQYSTFIRIEETEGFRLLRFTLDLEKISQEESSKTSYTEHVLQHTSETLDNRKNPDFVIVELGQTSVAGQRHYVYAFSEQPQVKSTVSRPLESVFPSLSTVFGGARG